MDFWGFIATQLGSSRLKINAGANTIHQLLDQDSDHRQYLKDIITQSYKRSRCHHLHAPINVNYVLDILGETAFELQGKHCDDLLDIELLEEIAWHIDERYAQHIDTGTLDTTESGKRESGKRESGKRESGKKADVLSLPRAKIRRANARH